MWYEIIQQSLLFLLQIPIISLPTRLFFISIISLSDDYKGCSINRIWDSSRWPTRYLDSRFNGISTHGNKGVRFFILIFVIINSFILAFIIVMIVVVAVTSNKSSSREVLYIDIIDMCVVPPEDLRPGVSIHFERDCKSIVASNFTVYLSSLNMKLLL